MKLIDKDKVLIEIERIKKEECSTDSYEGRCKLLWFEQFLSFINTLEMKEVDLEKEINLWFNYGLPNDEELLDYIKETAKHFFELGLKTKGE